MSHIKRKTKGTAHSKRRSTLNLSWPNPDHVGITEIFDTTGVVVIMAILGTSRHIFPTVFREQVVPAIAAVVAIGGQSAAVIRIQVEIVEAIVAGGVCLYCLAADCFKGTGMEPFVDCSFFAGVETVLLPGDKFAIVRVAS